MHNDSIQIYEEPPAPVGCRHSLANWTSVRLGNDPNNHTVDKSTMGQQDFNLIIDAMDQGINNKQGADPEIMDSDYSTDHLEDLEWSDNKYKFFLHLYMCVALLKILFILLLVWII